MSLESIKYERGSLLLLDQRRLPFDTTYIQSNTVKDAWQHIRDMVVRGAPAIGVTAALAIAVELTNNGGGSQFETLRDAVTYITEALDYLVTSRPTAVNLADSVNKLKAIAENAALLEGASPASIVDAIVAAAEAIQKDDITANKAIGSHGAALLCKEAAGRRLGSNGKLKVVTHCNTGSLATAGYGTALGIIRSLNELGKLEHAYCTETRPYNQGARLTAFELAHDGLPATLIVDSAAAALLASGLAHAVVVGADRVAANGDTANKVGTLALALAAQHAGVPFIVAAPTTTLDPSTPNGEAIVIEQRAPEEVTHTRGGAGERVAAEGVSIWNPAFDVTPTGLITAIVTERGPVPRNADGTHDVTGFIAGRSGTGPAPHPAADLPNGVTSTGGSTSTSTGARPSASVPVGFRLLDPEGVREYVASSRELQARVGPAEGAAEWRVAEVGDGNINYVFVVEGPDGVLCIKQAPPYVRCVGESWPLSQERLRIECEVMQRQRELSPHVPEVYLFDPELCIIAMQYIAPPHLILRKGLLEGTTFPHVAAHLAQFLASTLFHTSLLTLDSAQFRALAIRYNNPELCALTEKVIFTEPYGVASNNRWTTPELDADVADLRADVAAKVAALQLKAKFAGHAEALLHGDLHCGSVLVSADSSYVIDAEFAFVGPMAFDVAKVVGELLLSSFAVVGLEGPEGSRASQAEWLRGAAVEVWEGFSSRLRALWTDAVAAGKGGDLAPAILVGAGAALGADSLAAHQDAFLEELLSDVAQFSGAIIIRRIVGISHNAEYEAIKDVARKATCERNALRFGRRLLVEGRSFCSAAAIAAAAAAAQH